MRLSTIHAALRGQLHLPPNVLPELCFLQLRMLCELIAVECVVANANIDQETFQTLFSEFSADSIMKSLPNYLAPVEVVVSDGVQRLIPQQCDFLSKQDLLALYGRCGKYLHKGSLKTLSSQRSGAEAELSSASRWTQKIKNLMQSHVLYTHDGESYIYCRLPLDTNEKGTAVLTRRNQVVAVSE